MTNFKTPERRLWARLRAMRTLRIIDGRDITPQEDALADILTYVLVERGLAEAEKRAA